MRVCLHFFHSPRPYMNMEFPNKSEGDLKVHNGRGERKEKM